MSETMTSTKGNRPLNDYEKLILSRLLACDFKGRETVALQLRSVTARPLDDSGSIELVTDVGTRADVATRVPVEAQCVDVDGVPISVLLFVVNGFVNELEFSKADGSAIKRMPEPQALDVFPR